eukprot:2297349-Rhodomonas_salina.1
MLGNFSCACAPANCALRSLSTYMRLGADQVSGDNSWQIMQQISDHFLGEPDELQEIFEKLHFLVRDLAFHLRVVVMTFDSPVACHHSRSWPSACTSDWEAAPACLAVHWQSSSTFLNKHGVSAALCGLGRVHPRGAGTTPLSS